MLSKVRFLCRLDSFFSLETVKSKEILPWITLTWMNENLHRHLLSLFLHWCTFSFFHSWQPSLLQPATLLELSAPEYFLTIPPTTHGSIFHPFITGTFAAAAGMWHLSISSSPIELQPKDRCFKLQKETLCQKLVCRYRRKTESVQFELGGKTTKFGVAQSGCKGNVRPQQCRATETDICWGCDKANSLQRLQSIAKRGKNQKLSEPSFKLGLVLVYGGSVCEKEVQIHAHLLTITWLPVWTSTVTSIH